MTDSISSSGACFNSVFPIGDTNVLSLPVQQMETAVCWYADHLGFAEISRTDTASTLQRDAVTIGLAITGEDPEQASCYFSVSDVEALRQELEAKGLMPSPMRTDMHDGNAYRIFFAKEPGGVCFCFGQPA